MDLLRSSDPTLRPSAPLLYSGVGNAYQGGEDVSPATPPILLSCRRLLSPAFLSPVTFMYKTHRWPFLAEGLTPCLASFIFSQSWQFLQIPLFY